MAINLLTDARRPYDQALNPVHTSSTALGVSTDRGGPCGAVTVIGGAPGSKTKDGHARELDDPRQEGAGDGWRDGPRERSKSAASCHCSMPQKEKSKMRQSACCRDLFRTVDCRHG